MATNLIMILNGALEHLSKTVQGLNQIVLETLEDILGMVCHVINLQGENPVLLFRMDGQSKLDESWTQQFVGLFNTS